MECLSSLTTTRFDSTFQLSILSLSCFIYNIVPKVWYCKPQKNFFSQYNLIRNASTCISGLIQYAQYIYMQRCTSINMLRKLLELLQLLVCDFSEKSVSSYTIAGYFLVGYAKDTRNNDQNEAGDQYTRLFLSSHPKRKNDFQIPRFINDFRHLLSFQAYI